MSDIAIRVENLSKRYRIGELHQRHDTLRDALVDSLTRMTRIGRKNNSGHSLNSRQKEETIWALKDVSFEVKRGEVVGIIGRNGAGKSTLLKILSRITEPTSGYVEMHGRVGSLLEVGTGFHPELTGRENIYLSGAILGMRKREIDRKFDEIVAFAEIEKFIDTPVKRYSSGMYVRLAFAVAAHLDPEILLVDEVLAVGDAAFQKKCLGKMGDVAKEGRTVLFVSHNMAAIKHLCQRALVLVNGTAVFDGRSHQAVQFYISRMADWNASNAYNLCFYNPNPNSYLRFEVIRVEVLDKHGRLKQTLKTGDYARFRIVWRSEEFIEKGGVELGIHTLEGVHLIQYSTRPVSAVDLQFHQGENWAECEFQQFPLAAGQYVISVALTRPMVEWLYRNDSFGFLQVEEGDVFLSGVPIDSSRALVVVPHRWIVEE